MNSITLPGVSYSDKPTSETNARRIAILAADLFLEQNGYDFIHPAFMFEQIVYQSAKRLNLECDPLEEELRINQLQKDLKRRRIQFKEINPLKLMSESLTSKERKGELIEIKPIGGVREGEKSQRIRDGKGSGKISRSESENPLSVKNKRRTAISESRGKSSLSRTLGG